jgi:hypothetical protein
VFIFGLTLTNSVELLVKGIIASAPPITLAARLPFIGFNATEPKQRAYFAFGLVGMCA